jgi:hypothetical protein
VQQVSPVGVGFKIGELVHTKSVGPEGAEAARAKQAIALDACGWPDPLAVWRCIESCAQKTKK